MSQKLLHCKSVTAILPFSRVYKIRPEIYAVVMCRTMFKVKCSIVVRSQKSGVRVRLTKDELVGVSLMFKKLMFD